MEHTKGPWKIGKLESPVYGTDGSTVDEALLVYHDNTPIAHVMNVHKPVLREANARLIAAAPEMKDAISLAIRTINDCLRHYLEPYSGAHVTLETLIQENLLPVLKKAEGGKS